MSLVSFWFANKPRGKIDSVVLDATITERPSYTANITNEAIEDGSEISDNITINPRTLRLRAIITDTPLSQPANQIVNAIEDGRSRSKEAYDNLLELFENKEPFTVVTGLDIYSSVFFTAFEPIRNANTGQALAFSASFQEIVIAESQVAKIPRSKVRKKPPNLADKAQSAANKGTQATTNGDDLHQRSLAAGLYDVFKKRLKFSELPGVVT